MDHGNPYEPTRLAMELKRAGAPLALIHEQNQHLSAYPISIMPLVAALACLPWSDANLAWCLVSLVLFSASVWTIVQIFRTLPGKLRAASVCLLFSPAYVGLLNGNPSVLAISFTILALHFARLNRRWLSGILFGATLCVKPQIALCTLLAFLLWKRWSSMATGLAILVIVSAYAGLWISSLGQQWDWWLSLKRNAESLALPGSLIDPRPSSPYSSGFLNAQTLSYLLTDNTLVAEALVLVLTVGMLAVYFWRRRGDRSRCPLIDSAFFAAITLEVAYHRYYDGQLLLLLLPALAVLGKVGRRRSAMALAICFALVAFPTQSIFAKVFEPMGNHLSFAQIALFRHQPAAILAMALILSCERETEISVLEERGGPRPVRCGPRLPLL
jgi:hypothetical protein